MKPVRFVGDSLERLREFPEDARQDAGYQLEKVQRGEQPDDFKPMSTIGRDWQGRGGTSNLGRIWDVQSDLHRTSEGLRGRIARIPEEEPDDESSGC
jgi:hypothetical protein